MVEQQVSDQNFSKKEQKRFSIEEEFKYCGSTVSMRNYLKKGQLVVLKNSVSQTAIMIKPEFKSSENR